jgi:hypothetical protein
MVACSYARMLLALFVLLSVLLRRSAVCLLRCCWPVQGLLTQYAPVVLRGYYERDSRQQFCQPNLWTEPYSNMMASLEASQQQQAGGMLATTAAVVQALLAGVGLAAEEDEENGNSSTRPTSPAAAAAGVVSVGASSIPGLRTGALLLLLRSAPQCVPFAVRLELFRQMLQQDKVRCGATLGHSYEAKAHN